MLKNSCCSSTGWLFYITIGLISVWWTGWMVSSNHPLFLCGSSPNGYVTKRRRGLQIQETHRQTSQTCIQSQSGALSPEFTDQAALLWQVQEVNEEIYSRLGLLWRQPVDATEEGERVTDGELVVQRQFLPSGKNTDGEYILGLRINKLELHTLVHCSTLLTKNQRFLFVTLHGSEVLVLLKPTWLCIMRYEESMKSFEKVAS